MSITYLKNDEINKQKWDRCIDEAPNGIVYAYSIYLDHMSHHWDGLVLGDYDAVMPLTWHKKFGIYYLYQPFFTPALGVFGKTLDAEKVSAFLNSIPARFKYWDISLNHSNLFTNTGFPLTERMNYVLNLNRSYEDLYSAFSENHKRNIKKAQNSDCIVSKDLDVEAIIILASQQSKSFSPAKKRDYANFKSLFHEMQKLGKAVTYAVTKDHKVLASCAFLFSHGRAYYILVGNHPDGRTLGASQFLFNEFIREHAGTQLVLDFEGSQIPGLASFYSGFGAEEEKYAGLKMNKLTGLAKLFKK